MRLDRAWIEGHIPHRGSMCLLDEVMEWDEARIRCRSGTHRAADNPLRAHGRLGIACGIEYAAQAMAVHGALSSGTAGDIAHGTSAAAGTEPGRGPQVGLLAGIRAVRLHVLRLDDIESDLICDATRIAGDRATALYEFELWSAARRLMSGRATVVLDADNRLNRNVGPNEC